MSAFLILKSMKICDAHTDFLTEVKNKSFRIASYYLDENGEWICFEDHSSDSKWFCFITSHLTESSETIKTYKLEI